MAIALSHGVTSSYYLWFWSYVAIDLRMVVLTLNSRCLILLELLGRTLYIGGLWLLKYSLFSFRYFKTQVIRLSSRFISSYFNLSSLFIGLVVNRVRKVRIIMFRLRSWIHIIGLRLGLNIGFSRLSILVLISCWLGIDISSMLVIILRSALNIISLWLLVCFISIVVYCRICLFHIRIIVFIYWCI